LEPKEAEKPQLRFAEDILISAPTKPQSKTKKKKKKGSQDRDSDEEKVRGRRARRDVEPDFGDEDEY